jgi:6-phosphofructokinase 2
MTNENARAPTIVTLTVNPAIDIATSVPAIVPYHKLRCGKARRDPGGGGINVARVLIHFDTAATAIFPVGGGTGQLLQQLIRQAGIDIVPILIRGDTREDFTVTEEHSGKQFRFVLPGPTLTTDETSALLAALESHKPAPNYVVASGSLPAGVRPDFLASVGRVAHSRGARFVLDSSGPALRSALSEAVYLMKPNLREFGEIVGRVLETEAECLEAARKLLQERPISIIALTMGEEGALVITRDKVLRARAPRVRPLSTVGAGDSFLGAMIWRLSHEAPLEDAVRFGVAGGSAALLSPGTELCRRSDVEKLLSEVQITEL